VKPVSHPNRRYTRGILNLLCTRQLGPTPATRPQLRRTPHHQPRPRIPQRRRRPRPRPRHAHLRTDHLRLPYERPSIRPG
jgi:hypothetical protein